tara:strand:- start:489 stop:896 length:408 start_codon:yes stop_codon:yes gene_type:complete
MLNTIEIPGWPGYAVTDSGDVISSRLVVNGRYGPRKQRPRILKPFKTGKRMNYMAVTLSHNGTTRRAKVHQLVAAAFIGPCPEGFEVDHKDRNPMNNAADNLRYLPSNINRGKLMPRKAWAKRLEGGHDPYNEME